MKTFSFIALFCSAFVFAQQGTTVNTDNITYTYNGKTEKITLVLPKGSITATDGKLVINNRTYTIETIDAPEYSDGETVTEKGSEEDKQRQSGILAFFWASRSKNPTTDAEAYTSSHRMKLSEDKELIDTFYGYNIASNKMVENLGGAKVLGNSILVITMDDTIDTQGEEIKKNEEMLFNVLDSATLVSAKPVKKAK